MYITVRITKFLCVHERILQPIITCIITFRLSLNLFWLVLLLNPIIFLSSLIIIRFENDLAGSARWWLQGSI